MCRTNDKENHVFGKFIREQRKKKGLTQSEATRKAEIDQTQWSKIERGKRFLYSPRELLKISQTLDVPLDEIIIRAAGGSYNEDEKITIDE